MFDIVIIGYAVNQSSGGYSDKKYVFLDTSDAKYLYNNCFLDTYCAEPMAFEQLAAQIEAEGLSVDVIDGLILGLDCDALEKEFLKRDSRVFAFSIYESTVDDVFSMINKLRQERPNVTIILGGPYATIAAEELLNKNLNIDAIIVGDGDEAMPLLAKAVRDKIPLDTVPNLFYRKDGIIVRTPARAVDLNILHPPKRLYTNEIMRRGYAFSISAGRGCGYANCGFCYLKNYQKIGCQPKFRFKMAKIVFDEICELIDRFGTKIISFTDEDFFGDDRGLQRAIELFHMLIDAKIDISLHVNARAKTVIWLAKNNLLKLCAEAGVKYMYVGLESYNDDALIRYDKGITTADIDYVVSMLEKYNIRINPGLITFDPMLTPDQVKRNIDLYRKIQYYDVFIFTRRLVFYPQASKKVMEMRELNRYFSNPKTEKLFMAMEQYRDLVFPWCMKLNRSCATDDVCAKLKQLHFDCFYQAFEKVKKNELADVRLIAEEAIKTIKNVIGETI